MSEQVRGGYEGPLMVYSAAAKEGSATTPPKPTQTPPRNAQALSASLKRHLVLSARQSSIRQASQWSTRSSSTSDRTCPAWPHPPRPHVIGPPPRAPHPRRRTRPAHTSRPGTRAQPQQHPVPPPSRPRRGLTSEATPYCRRKHAHHRKSTPPACASCPRLPALNTCSAAFRAVEVASARRRDDSGARPYPQRGPMRSSASVWASSFRRVASGGGGAATRLIVPACSCIYPSDHHDVHIDPHNIRLSTLRGHPTAEVGPREAQSAGVAWLERHGGEGRST